MNHPNTSTMLLEPRLPQDLKRVIFEMAARSDRDATLPALLQVARRVQDWLKPIIYDTVVLKDASFYRNAKSPLHRPPRFPSGPQVNHVRNLLVAYEYADRAPSEPNWEEFLSQCHNLEDFAIWIMRSTTALSLLTSALQSPLRTVKPHGLLRLSAFIFCLFSDGRVDFDHVIFKDLTHLEVLDSPGEAFNHWVEGNNYGCIPNLRYLTITNPDFDLPAFTGIVQRCLEECKVLDVLILMDENVVVREKADELLKATRRIVSGDGAIREIQEDRVVAYKWTSPCSTSWSEDWYNSAVCGGTARGEDFWVRSEEIVKRRRRRRELEARSWHSMIDSGVDIDLMEWFGALHMC